MTLVTKAAIRLIKLPGGKIRGNSAYNSAIVYTDTKRKLSLTANVRCATPFVPDFEVPKRVFGFLKKEKKKGLHLKTPRDFDESNKHARYSAANVYV